MIFLLQVLSQFLWLTSSNFFFFLVLSYLSHIEPYRWRFYFHLTTGGSNVITNFTELYYNYHFFNFNSDFLQERCLQFSSFFILIILRKQYIILNFAHHIFNSKNSVMKSVTTNSLFHLKRYMIRWNLIKLVSNILFSVCFWF